ncbi:MAG: cytochrome c-type biogenesis protein [Arenicellales bacterium]
MRVLVLAVLLAVNSMAYAVIEVRHFDDPAKKQLYEKLTYELRCLVCQNENLAGSDADLAADLRNEIYAMVRKGKSEKDILDYMVARYGQFVLYRPRVESTTLLLWGGPGLLLVLGLILIIVMARRRAASAGDVGDDERREARKLLGD